MLNVVPAATAAADAAGAPALMAMLPLVTVNRPDVTVSVWLPTVSSVTLLSVRTPLTKRPVVGESRLPMSESRSLRHGCRWSRYCRIGPERGQSCRTGCRRSRCSAHRGRQSSNGRWCDRDGARAPELTPVDRQRLAAGGLEHQSLNGEHPVVRGGEGEGAEIGGLRIGAGHLDGSREASQCLAGAIVRRDGEPEGGAGGDGLGLLRTKTGRR